jgi:hypothetical protein
VVVEQVWAARARVKVPALVPAQATAKPEFPATAKPELPATAILEPRVFP